MSDEYSLGGEDNSPIFMALSRIRRAYRNRPFDAARFDKKHLSRHPDGSENADGERHIEVQSLKEKTGLSGVVLFELLDYYQKEEDWHRPLSELLHRLAFDKRKS